MRLVSPLLAILTVAVVYAPAAAAKSKAPVSDDDNAGSSSAEVRAGQNYGIAAAYGSPGAGVLMPGVEAYYLLGKAWQFTAAYYQAKKTESTPSATSADGSVTTSGGNASLKSHSFNIGARRFFGNSFYAQGNLGTNWYNVDINVNTADTASGGSAGSYGTTLTAQTIFAHLGIGNEWSFGNGLFIDCQWIGYAAPVIGGYTYKTNSSGADADASVNSVLAQASDDLGHTITKHGNVSAAIALGWAH